MLGRFIHGFQRFPRLLCAGDVIGKGDGRRHRRRSNGQPHRRRPGQRRKEPLPAAARLAHGGGKLADAGGQCAHTFGNLAQHQQYRPGGSGIGRHLHDLLALCLVHFEEARQQVIRAVDEFLYRRVEVVPDLLGEQYGGVFEVGEPRFRGRVALIGLLGERGVLIPRDIGHLLRLGEQLVGIDGAQQCVAQADLRDADLLQGGDGGDAPPRPSVPIPR